MAAENLNKSKLKTHTQKENLYLSNPVKFQHLI